MKKFLKTFFIILLILIILVLAYMTFNGYTLYKTAIDRKSINDKVSEIRNDENFTKLDDISKDFKNAIVATEDCRFYEHSGFDIKAIIRAILYNFQMKSFEQGGSTITQQLAKNMYFITEHSYSRKFAELFVTHDLENNYSKDEILELYLNNIYYGDGYYNIREASLGYFDKEPKDLTLYEATLLAGIPNAPSVYALTNRPDLAEERRQHVLNTMVREGYLTEKEANEVRTPPNNN